MAQPVADTTSMIQKTAFGSDMQSVFKLFDQTKVPIELHWENVTFSLRKRGCKERSSILDSLAGEVRPGQLVAILGPSGSGKTTLLNVLSGRMRNGGRGDSKIDGKIYANGVAIDPTAHQARFGYVMQDDALLGTMTPTEVIDFAARLKLTGEMSKLRNQIVGAVIAALGLTNCARDMVGNQLIKGISGGERKRTSIGAEIITDPDVTFLDEPTSGLDMAAAYAVISILKQLSTFNRAVLCTIHQPSSDIFHLFDQTIFLVSGKVAYSGPPSEIQAYFGRLEHKCPASYNPADFVMFLCHTSDEETMRKLLNAWKPPPANTALGQEGALAMKTVAPRHDVFLQLALLTKRDFKNYLRDKATIGARYGSTAFLSTLFALIFAARANLDESDWELQSHQGALTMVLISSMFGVAQPLLLVFSSERPVFMRERSGNMYCTAAYFFSKTIVELPFVMLQLLLQLSIVYWAIGFNGKFPVLYASMILVGLASGSTALLVACCVQDAKQAMELAPACFVPQILFAGFFVKLDTVWVGLRWLQYLCALKWGANIALWEEFSDSRQARPLLEANDIDENTTLLSIGVLMAIYFGFRIVAASVLSWKAKRFYN